MNAPAAAMAEASALTGLLGRERESGSIERFLLAHEGGALLLEGPPGIGKTSLWQSGVKFARARGMRVLATRSAEAERELAYTGLADLLADVDIGSVTSLPTPQRTAIESALLIRLGATSVNPQAVSAGLLCILRALASTVSVLVAVDDLPWLDEPTASALAFAARRLGSIHFLLASRANERSPVVRALQRAPLERLLVGPLDAAELRQLIHSRLGLSLPRRTMQRLLETCAGNPLYALELGKALSAAPQSQLGAELPLTRNLEDELVEHVSGLKAPVQRLLLAVALGPGTALSALPGIDALADALEVDAVVLEDDRVRPTHPLLGAAAIACASSTERRAMHLELAAAVTDDEVRAHHLALATDLPDPVVAATVAAAAIRAMNRGAAATAAQLGQHALRLTPASAPEQIERQLTAVEYLSAAGQLERGRTLIPAGIESLVDVRQRVRAYLLAADLGLASPPLPPDHSYRAWTDLALAESRADPELHASVLAQCVSARAVAEIQQLGEFEASLIAADAAADRLDQASELMLISSLAWLRSFRGGQLGDLVQRASSLDADALPLHQGIDRVLALREMWRGGTSAPRSALSELLRGADERGEAESYFVMRLHLCELELRAGEFSAAGALLDEWAQEADEPVNALAAFARCQALLAAYRGHDREVETWVARIPAEDGDGTVADRWQWLEAQRARGIAFLCAGSPVPAVASLRPVWDYTRAQGVVDPGIFPVAPDLVEALVGARARELARPVAEAITRAATELDHPWAAVTALRCAALLELGTPQATRELIEAEAAYATLGLGFDQARTLLALGASYRGQRQKDRSAQTFERAAAAFDRLGSDGWAERARSDLVRVAGRAQPDGRLLTPTEQEVAQLVATGRRNREVAASLFISEKTVEAHLSHIYAKLGIRSRTELASRLHSLDKTD
jgi:DNA-binding NarL/FixJ family response regulator